MAEILNGAKIVNKSGESVDVATITGSGKTVGIYFSAHWCPPCRGFTPQLASFYDKLKQSGHADNFEIVFVSCDRDLDSFKSYYGDMPWLALDFSDKVTQERLKETFSLTGIPSLIIINGENGEVKDATGRATVASNLKSGSFPASWS